MNEKAERIWKRSAALSVAPMIFVGSVYTPALGAISKAFPDVNQELVKQITSLPALMTMIFAILYGFLAQRYSTRKLVIAGSIIITIGSLVPAFGGDMMVILAMRALTGVGQGLIYPAASTVIVELFEGMDRKAMMGYKSTVGNIAAIIYQTLGGILCAISWRTTFWGYLPTLIPILIILFKLPEVPPVKKARKTESISNDSKLTKMTYVLTIFNFVYVLMQWTLQTNLSIVLAATKVGDSIQSGFILSSFTLAGAAGGIIYVHISKIVRKYTLPMAVLFVGSAFVILIFANDLTSYYIAAIVFGIGFGIYNSEFVLLVVNSAGKEAFTLALTWYVAIMRLGVFLSPILLSLITETLGLKGPKAAWYVAGPVLVAGAVIVTIILALQKSGDKAALASL